MQERRPSLVPFSLLSGGLQLKGSWTVDSGKDGGGLRGHEGQKAGIGTPLSLWDSSRVLGSYDVAAITREEAIRQRASFLGRVVRASLA